MTDIERDLRLAPLPSLDSRRLAEALARRAADEGLLDVAYATTDSPVGELTVFVTPRGLVRLAYPEESQDEVLAQLAARVSSRILRTPGPTDQVRRELDAYFSGRRQAFDLPVDWTLIHGFAQGVLRATAKIPFGSVTTYGQLATRAGSPRAARAVGNALASNPIPIVVPCHRVLHADGGLGGYTGGLDRKRFLLALEGSRSG